MFKKDNMKLKKLLPVTNGLRHQIILPKFLLSKTNRLNKTLLVGKKNFAGRSSQTGRITVRHQGGGCKRLYRVVNFTNIPYFGLILAVCYDPIRNTFLNYNYNLKTTKTFFTLSLKNLYPGALICCNHDLAEYKLGSRLQISHLPIGTLINAIATNFHNAAKYARAAGTYGQILQLTEKICKVRLPSGNIFNFLRTSYATIGCIANSLYHKQVVGKAGRNRLKGKRPSVRGIAMNPVDHPHGGRTNGGRPSVTPWGLPTKGKPTVKKN
jgi:large subunit ribosomal protein L2